MHNGSFMNRATITLKNVPRELHRSLKESAKRHKRSLNQEAIHVLETSLSASQSPGFSLHQPPPPQSVGKILVSRDALLARADELLDRET